MIMKFKLIESLDQPFDEVLYLEYDANDVCFDEDRNKAQGTITIRVESSDIVGILWDLISNDKKDLPLSDKDMELLYEDDDAYEDYLKNNFNLLISKYDEELHNMFREDARDVLYNNWSHYSDELPFSQREEDRKEYYRNISGGI